MTDTIKTFLKSRLHLHKVFLQIYHSLILNVKVDIRLVLDFLTKVLIGDDNKLVWGEQTTREVGGGLNMWSKG